jgi:hypothetical protein
MSRERDEFPYKILFIFPGLHFTQYPGLESSMCITLKQIYFRNLAAENYSNATLISKALTPCSQNLTHQENATQLWCAIYSLRWAVEQSFPQMLEVIFWRVFEWFEGSGLIICLKQSGPSVIRIPTWYRKFWANYSPVFAIEIITLLLLLFIL